MPMTCCCADARPRAAQPTLAVFSEVRQRCPALLNVLLPADAWEAVVAEEKQRPDGALHASSILLAFTRGHLFRITGPVHRFLLEGTQPHQHLTTQYQQDLQERWLFAQDVVKRHDRSRQFLGRIAELQLASWLADMGWHVSTLEALGGNVDIVADSPTSNRCSFEVKYIGWDTAEFLRVVDALAGGDDGGAMPARQGVPAHALAAANYLLFRTYEAARKLRHLATTRIAAVVIDAMGWHSFSRALEDRWIKLNRAAFFGAREDWVHFLREYPELDTDLSSAISTLNQLWVFRFAEYECVLTHELSPQDA